MIAEAIEKILSIAPSQIIEKDGHTFVVNRKGFAPLEKKPPDFTPPKALQLATLQGLVDYIRHHEEKQNRDMTLLIVIAGYNEVKFITELMPENHNQRFCYASAKVLEGDYPFDIYISLEKFIVLLQSGFVIDDTVLDVLGVVGNLADEHVISAADDGVHQTVQVKTGITTKSPKVLTNPVRLQPYRTFREVEQPASDFVIRIKKENGQIKCGLFTADGGSWKINAIENIKTWLGGELMMENVYIIG